MSTASPVPEENTTFVKSADLYRVQHAYWALRALNKGLRDSEEHWEFAVLIDIIADRLSPVVNSM